MIVHEVAAVANLLLVEVRLLKHLVLEEVVGLEVELQLEARLGVRARQVLDPDVGEALEGLRVAVGDDFAEVDVRTEGGQPELGNARG